MKSIPKQKKLVIDYTKKAVEEMLSWAVKHYHLDEKIINKTLIISFDNNRIYSYGGWHKIRNRWKPYLNFAFSSCIDFRPMMYKEYEWYSDDPIIGKRYVRTWKDYIRMLVAHEISHILELSSLYINDKDQKEFLTRRFGRSNLDEDHGEVFQKIYKVLRRKFVNNIRRDKKIKA